MKCHICLYIFGFLFVNIYTITCYCLDMEDYLSVTQYALLHNKDVGNIRHLLLDGRLSGTKIGNQWVIKKDTPYPEDRRLSSGNYINQRQKQRLYQKKPLMKNILSLIKELGVLYQKDLTSIVIYGSYARGTETNDSDIDIALFINKQNKKRRNRMIEIVSEYELVSGKVISVIEINNHEYEEWKQTMPLYRNIQKEGIILWKNS